METITDTVHPAKKFRQIAARIRNEPNARDAIADGFELIAASIDAVQVLVNDAMAECQECGQPGPLDAPAAPVINPLDLPDLPDLGADHHLDSTGPATTDTVH